MATLSTIARRSGYKMLRTPQIAGIAVVQSLVFLFMFRYVIGGGVAPAARGTASTATSSRSRCPGSTSGTSTSGS